MSRFIAFLLLALAAWWFATSTDTEAVILADGSLEYPGYTIRNPEPFMLEARVLSREDYFTDDGAKLSPTDLALGWGPMADEDVLRSIQIRQSGRWYYWRADALPIPREDIQTHSANVHMVPANELAARDLGRVSRHDRIRVTGQLVDIYRDDGWRWLSSRSRTDTGAGSCELLLLDRIEFL